MEKRCHLLAVRHHLHLLLVYQGPHQLLPSPLLLQHHPLLFPQQVNHRQTCSSLCRSSRVSRVVLGTLAASTRHLAPVTSDSGCRCLVLHSRLSLSPLLRRRRDPGSHPPLPPKCSELSCWFRKHDQEVPSGEARKHCHRDKQDYRMYSNFSSYLVQQTFRLSWRLEV